MPRAPTGRPDVQWFKTNYPNQIEPHSINKPTPSGESCIHLTAYNSDQAGAVEVLRRFMNSGGRFSAPARNPRGANPTALAVNILRGNVEAVRSMLEVRLCDADARKFECIGMR